MANLMVGINLDNRTLALDIPDNTIVDEFKYIAKVNSNNYIAESVISGECLGYYHFLNDDNEPETAIFYQSDGSTTSVNMDNVTLPDNFGTITEVDETAVLFEYINRNSHEKVYVVSEDYSKKESMAKEDIQEEVEEQARSYGVPVNSFMGFDGDVADLPGGYEIIDNPFDLDTVPIGVIKGYAGSTIPTGYLLCDGSAVSRTEYSDLFEAIGTSFGAGDGSTTFNLPNLKGRVPVGYDNSKSEFDTLGENGGETEHSLTNNELPNNMGSTKLYGYTGSSSNGIITSNDDTETTYGLNNTGSVRYKNITLSGGGQAHNNLQPYLVINYIIKAETVVNVRGRILNSYNESVNDVYSAYYINQAIGNIADVLDTINGEEV